MIDIPLKNPKPDYEEFIRVLNGTSPPKKVHIIEVIIDKEIKKYIIENYINEESASPAMAYGTEGGRKDDIIENFISEIKCDALHSFEDICCPVVEYKKKYGSRVALLGGVDVNVLAGSPGKEVRGYVRDILETCMEGGRYALGQHRFVLIKDRVVASLVY